MRLITTAALLGGLAAGLLAVPADAASDTSFPTGTFHFVQDTTYLRADELSMDEDSARLTLVADQLSDDRTPSQDLTVKVLDGSGRASPAPFNYPEDEGFEGPFALWSPTDQPLALYYDRIGVYSPKVFITDADGNTTIVPMPDVSVLTDRYAPTYTLDSPRPGVRKSLAAWRVLRGRIKDDGVGGESVIYQVMQKRRGTWYYFKDRMYFEDTRSGYWVKGRRTLAATKALRKNENLDTNREPPGKWRSDRIPKLTRGPIVACTYAEDINGNETRPRCISATITRR